MVSGLKCFQITTRVNGCGEVLDGSRLNTNARVMFFQVATQAPSVERGLGLTPLSCFMAVAWAACSAGSILLPMLSHRTTSLSVPVQLALLPTGQAGLTASARTQPGRQVQLTSMQ